MKNLYLKELFTMTKIENMIALEKECTAIKDECKKKGNLIIAWIFDKYSGVLRKSICKEAIKSMSEN